MRKDDFWNYVNNWEENFAIGWEPWEQDESRRERGRQASALLDQDARKALDTFEVLSDEGYVWAMRFTGSLYRGQHGIEQNLTKVENNYRAAIDAGSWMATLELSKILNRRGISDDWEALLVKGDQAGFVPSSFWLAWYRYKRKPARKTAREVRPLLEAAIKADHPGAKMLLLNWQSQGKFGLREIRQGFQSVGEVIAQFDSRKMPSDGDMAKDIKAQA